VAIVTIFISVGSNIASSELSVIHFKTIGFSDPLLPDDRIKLLVEGLPNDLSNIEASYFRIKNTSMNPIKPENIIASLSVKKGKGIKRILLVESCSSKLAQLCSSNSSESTSSPYIDLSWTAQTNEKKWHSTSELINPGEQACVLLVSEKDPPDVQSILKRFNWAARIENIKLKIYSSENSYANDNLSKNTDIFFQIVVVLFGAGVYWFFGLFVVFLPSYIICLFVQAGFL